jgi:hypothetical protein
MKSKSILQIVLYVALWLYIVISQIMTVVFWWEMMLEDNIIATIFIDPFIAEIKGILWPFFI